MLIKILCFLLGHKTTVKAMTGDQFETYHRLYPEVKVKENYYIWQKLKFCARCGKKVKDE